MMTGPAAVLAGCLMLASQTYHVPPAVMVGIMQVEGGRVGQEVGNTNGTYDMGPMQINTIWLSDLSKYWNVSQSTARTWVRDNGCVNMHVAAWILRRQLDKTNNLYQAIAYYHSATPEYGQPYARKVIKAMERHGLIDYNAKTATPSKTATSTQRIAQR